MHTVDFIQDLAVVMLVAGAVTVLFHRFKQPVVLGYIVAGVIIGPHTPPFSFVHDEGTIRTLAELGVVFLMFSLGLEFSLRKLARVGGSALVAALLEIFLMIWMGYAIGRFFGWGTMDCIFLGSLLAISSTTIIVKALDELGMKRERFAHLIFGILIIEDILAIGMIALLSVIAVTGSVTAGAVIATLGKLALFVTVALVLGILIVPRLLEYVARFESKEMLLVCVLGISFGFCLLVIKLDYSTALGAFLIGAVMAESKQMRLIEQLTQPIKDMFSAIFFVTIGLLFDPDILIKYAAPVAVITLVVVMGKVVSCSLGTFLGGNDGRTSLRVGMGLAQIGEFSFIIASLGVTLDVTSNFLFPVAVAVSSATTLLTPYLIRFADPFSVSVSAAMPSGIVRIATVYTTWLQNIRPHGNRATLAKIMRRVVLQILVNMALVITVFILGGAMGDKLGTALLSWIAEERIRDTAIWSGALLLSLPFLIASYRKLKGLSMMLAELSMKPGAETRQYTEGIRRVISEVIPVAFIVGLMLLIAGLSTAILPPVELLIVVLLTAAGLLALLWKRLERIHSRLQNALLNTLGKKRGRSRTL